MPVNACLAATLKAPQKSSRPTLEVIARTMCDEFLTVQMGTMNVFCELHEPELLKGEARPSRQRGGRPPKL